MDGRADTLQTNADGLSDDSDGRGIGREMSIHGTHSWSYAGSFRALMSAVQDWCSPVSCLTKALGTTRAASHRRSS